MLFLVLEKGKRDSLIDTGRDTETVDRGNCLAYYQEKYYYGKTSELFNIVFVSPAGCSALPTLTANGLKLAST